MERGTIRAVGAAASVTASVAAVRDLGDAILLPGLVDAHCHLEWSLLDGVLAPDGFAAWLGRLLPLRARMTPADHAAAARLGALRALRAGTTTLADSGPTGAGVGALAEIGLRGVAHLEVFGREEGAEAERAAALVEERVQALDAASGPRVRVGVSPHAPYTVGPGLWSALARRRGLAERPWATHLAESADEERAIATGDGALGELFAGAGLTPGRWPGPPGAGPVRRLDAAGALRRNLVAAHGVRLRDGEAALLRERGVAVAHCPRSNAHLRCGRAPIAALRAAGTALGLGTDSPASGGDYDLRAEARACAAACAGDRRLEPAALLALATEGGARALGLEGRVGALAPGMRADLVAVRPGGPVHDPHAAALDARARVATVVVDGEVLLADGRPARVDADAVETAARRARERLC